MLWVPLEAPQRGTSNEYPQHMFSSRNKKDIRISIFRMKKAPYLLLWIFTKLDMHLEKKVQSALNLCWVHMSEDMFPNVAHMG